MNSKKPVVLVDGSSYLYRAFHALPPLSNTKGNPTGAVYGVVSMIKKLMTDYDPEYIAVVFDPKGKTHRDAIYSEYKSHRPPMPTDLSLQVPPLLDIIKDMGLPILIYEGIEADDVIGTLAVAATKLGKSTLISTGDKDMAQLVNDHVTLINTMSGILFDREGVIKKFGIPPELIVDYLALIGDKVDNIPGIPSVGPKTAVKWLLEFGGLSGIIKNADTIKGKVGEALRENLEHLHLSAQLVTIYTDLDLPIQITDLRKQEPNKEALIKLYKELEFKSWLSELLEEQVDTTHYKYDLVDTVPALESWINRLGQAKIFAFDVETTHSDVMQAKLVGISFAIAPHEAAYVPLTHNYEGVPQQLPVDLVLEKIKPLLSDPQKTLVGHNLKFEINILLHHGIEIKNKIYDTMLESYIQNSASSRHDLDTLSLKYLGKRTITFEDVAGKGAKQISFDKVHIDSAVTYAAEDADVTLQLHNLMWSMISKDEELAEVFTGIEMPLTHVLARMERVGVLLDVALLQKHSVELSKRLQQLEEEAFTLAGTQFNLSSPKQLQTILYEKLQLPILSKTPTGQPSTSEDILQELARSYPLPNIILEHRSLNKLKTTYTDRLPLQVNPKTGRVHTCYNQAITATGRLSSTDPNLQNIPIRNEEARRIRQAFIAPAGYKIVSADYSQIELRIMAHLSQDPGLLQAFESGQDVHRATAADVFNVNLESVTHQQRRSAKTINFGLIYGMSAFGLSKALGISRDTAQEYINLYFQRYPRIQAYMEQTKELAHRNGCVKTYHGRRLFLPEIHATNLQRKKAAERAAINAPLQGTAADIIKLAMINIDQWLQQSSIKAKMIMQVHDELVFEVLEKDVLEVIPLIKEHMISVIKLDVPLAVDIGIGDNWDEAH